MKLTPASTDACSVRIDSSSSTGPHDPPIAHAPKLIVDTSNPVRPSRRYRIPSPKRYPQALCPEPYIIPRMNRHLILALFVAVACAALGAQSPSLTQDALKGLPLRSIGPDI